MAERPSPLVRLLGLAAARLDRQMLATQHAAGHRELRMAHSQVFANVPPEGIRLSVLAERAGMTKQAMAELVADLEGLGYLERSNDPTDGRAKLISFTERGWASVRLALDTFDAQESSLGESLGPRRVAALRKILTDILAHTEEG